MTNDGWIPSTTGRLDRRSLLAGLGAGTAALSMLPASRALAAYPDKPIKLIVPNTPGGPSDVAARLLSPGLQDALKGSVIVENIGGGAVTSASGAQRGPIRTATRC